MATAQQGYFSTMAVDDWGVWNATLPAQLVGTPMMAVYTNKSDSDFDDCSNGKNGTAACKNALAGYHLQQEETLHLAALTGNASFYGCNDPKCDLGFQMRFPSVIVDALNQRAG